MDNERIREICMGLPHVAETLNWGHYLVYWAGDREIGGKMFALTDLSPQRRGPDAEDLDSSGKGVLSFHCGAERYHELIENEGIVPAPHLARAYWVMLERWDALRPREIEQELRRARELIFERLPKRTREILAMPEAERKRLIRSRKSDVKQGSPAKKKGSRKKPGSRKKA